MRSNDVPHALAHETFFPVEFLQRGGYSLREMGDDFSDELERCQERIGTTVRGKWHLDSLVGVGGMAAVYAATHRGGPRSAIKILHAHVAFSKELRARFEQEALAIARLRHPATVQVLDIDVTDEGAPFMVMELLDGESLGQRAHRAWTAGAPIEPRELLGYVETLLDVLVAAHAAGIVHRDIKPDNLFVTNDGRLKVLDFGIARMREGTGNVQTRTGAMLGTTSYMAPEQIHGRPVDGRVDLFAVGATMFRILSSRRIHEADTDAELLIKMGSTQAPPLSSVAPHVDPRIATIIDRALTFDRDRRFPDARTMLDDVRAVLRGDAPPFSGPAVLTPSDPTRVGHAGAGHARGGYADAGPTGTGHAGMGQLDSTRARGAHGNIVVVPPSSGGASAVHARTMGDAPTLLAIAAPVIAAPSTRHPSSLSAVEASTGYTAHAGAPVRQRTAPVAVAVGIGAVMISIGAIVAAAFLIGDCGGPKRSNASSSDEEEDDRPRRNSASETAERPATTAAKTSTSKKKLRGEDLERELQKYKEESKRKKSKKRDD